MSHLLLFYLFLSFSFGMISLTMAGLCYRRFKDPIAHAFLWFYGAFSLVVLAKLFFSYGDANRLPRLLVFFFGYTESLIGKFALMFTLAFLVHRLVPVPNPKKRNTVVALVAALTFLAQNATEYLIGIKIVDTLGDYFEDLVFLAVCAYCFWVAKRYSQGISSPAIRILTRRFLFLWVVFLPGVLFDMFLDDTSPVRFYPLIYCCVGWLFTAHFTKTQEIVPPTGDFEAFLTDAGISSREKDVVRLILDGLSNAQIAESLFVSPNTVKTHLRNIFRKLEVENRFQLMALSQERASSLKRPLSVETASNHPDG